MTEWLLRSMRMRLRCSRMNSPRVMDSHSRRPVSEQCLGMMPTRRRGSKRAQAGSPLGRVGLITGFRHQPVSTTEIPERNSSEGIQRADSRRSTPKECA